MLDPRREITSASLQRLLGIGQSVLNDLAKRGIIVRGTKRGSYALEPSVVGYCSHLREIAAGRGGDAGGDARARLGSEQADLAEAKAARMRGETVNASDVEKQWTGKMREFRSRILSVPDRVPLPLRERNVLTTELCDALTELADNG